MIYIISEVVYLYKLEIFIVYIYYEMLVEKLMVDWVIVVEVVLISSNVVVLIVDKVVFVIFIVFEFFVVV